MVPPGEADFLVLLDAGQLEPNRHLLRPGGILIEPGMIDVAALASPRSLNVALAGALSAWLGIPEEDWLAAVRSNLSERLRKTNLAAFEMGRSAAAGKQVNGA
jgi:indolepyruvate ferredoxin oxidoreductase, beta subunit